MIRYDRLWVTMEACGMTQYRLINGTISVRARLAA